MPKNSQIEYHEIQTAGLIVINNNKLLLAHSQNKQAWYLPGGKREGSETAIESLRREITEELQVHLSSLDLRYYVHISAPAFGETDNTIMEQECFIGPANFPYSPSKEITAIRYFSFKEYLSQRPVVPGVVKVFEKLAYDGLITLS